MAEPGYKLPRRDIARLNRVVTAYEAGQPHVPQVENAPKAGQLRAMTLQFFNPGLSQGDISPIECVPLELCRDRIYLLRFPASDPRPFKLYWNGEGTDELTEDSSAETIQSALQATAIGSAVYVIGRGILVGDAHAWNVPTWYIRLGDDVPDGTLSYNIEPGDWAENVKLYRTLDWPADRVEQVYPRFAGDEQIAAGSIVTALAQPGLGWRIWSASLRRPAPCPPLNAIIHLFLFGPPTGGTWKLTLRIPFEDPETEVSEVLNYEIEDLGWDCTAEDLQEAIDGHSALAGNITVTGGPADDCAFSLEFHDDLGHQPIPLPFIHWGDLEGVMLGGQPHYAQIGRAPEAD